MLNKIEKAVPKARKAPPIHTWNPPFSGDMDMRIAVDGTWHYLGTPINHKALVRLFSTILLHEDDRYFLITPVEKYAIQVEDAPFLAVEMTVEKTGREQEISFRTNVDDHVTADKEHPLRFAQQQDSGETRPYVLVRDRLEALIVRSVFYDLVELGTVHEYAGTESFGVWSCGEFFPMGPAADLEL